MKFAQAEVNPGTWKLAPNDVWNVPSAPVKEFKFELTRGPWHEIYKLRGLAVSIDGKIYGERNLLNPHENGYDLVGRVSIGGRKFRALTSSQIFERPDGSLVKVAVLIVCRDTPFAS